ncbi:AraC family transcriptional regulator [Pseudomonas sp. Leaf127]|uniref:helix-turn-helix domain-containing protein n=1 Tax=Pseudomonas sp. Leaf127 TaxID=1736267 RepID=UPI000702F27B|nr:helix-turn-helix domain-containing protein [Pseudomonas sp. Leaf127]KQQ49860.1 AraC family transcriptional regulator [Pseudomonas sp. Leaf127]
MNIPPSGQALRQTGTRQHHDHFDVAAEPVANQLLAWRRRVGHVIDVLPSSADVNRPFRASIDLYRLGGRVFTDCSSDNLLLDRPVARISTDSMRDYVFQVYTQGGIDCIESAGLERRQLASASIMALDLNQPIRMHRSRCRVLTFFVPRLIVEQTLPHAESLHGRVFENDDPLTRLLIKHVAGLSKNLPGMSESEGIHAFDISIQLMLGAFAKQAKLSGNVRAAARSAMFDQARRYIKEHLYQPWLTPESALSALQLPRATVYRLFQHEGGLGRYIINCRLREAADEIVRYPNRQIIEIAYSLGFNSASDFTRAFRRHYGMSPQDHRYLALQKKAPSFSFARACQGT